MAIKKLKQAHFPRPDHTALYRYIKKRSLVRTYPSGFSQFVDYSSEYKLTDLNGPRLTNSPGYRKATTWAITHLKAGISAGPEAWGE